MLPSNKTTQDALPSKVPQITLSFWILKLLTTGMGEAASDFVLGVLARGDDPYARQHGFGAPPAQVLGAAAGHEGHR